MGTNYYAVEKTYRYGRKEVHLGKSSCGWLFTFSSCDEFRTFPQFKHWLEENVDTGKYIICDEYGSEVAKQDLLNLIEEKQNDPHCRDNPRNFEYNYNIDGYRFAPNGEFW